MARRSALRASDLDREHVAERLRNATAEGRLLASELEERLGAALSARTYGELDSLVSDLPAVREEGVGRIWVRVAFVAAVVMAVLAVIALVALIVLGIAGAWLAWMAVMWVMFGRRGCRGRYVGGSRPWGDAYPRVAQRTGRPRSGPATLL